jgi:hypothetical protein
MPNKTLAALLIAVLATTGCADMSATQRGTATGAGVGAGIGAVLGAATGPGGGKRAAGGAAIGAAVGAVVGNVWSKRMEAQKQQMEQATQGTGVQVSQTGDNRLKLEIPSDISFDTGRSDIKPDFRPVLDRFATTLNENPATTVSPYARLPGHARRIAYPHRDRRPRRAGADRLQRRRSRPRTQPPRGNLRGRATPAARLSKRQRPGAWRSGPRIPKEPS